MEHGTPNARVDCNATFKVDFSPREATKNLASGYLLYFYSLFSVRRVDGF
jgi:hypothetical protein